MPTPGALDAVRMACSKPLRCSVGYNRLRRHAPQPAGAPPQPRVRPCTGRFRCPLVVSTVTSARAPSPFGVARVRRRRFLGGWLEHSTSLQRLAGEASADYDYGLTHPTRASV